MFYQIAANSWNTTQGTKLCVCARVCVSVEKEKIFTDVNLSNSEKPYMNSVPEWIIFFSYFSFKFLSGFTLKFSPFSNHVPK